MSTLLTSPPAARAETTSYVNDFTSWQVAATSHTTIDFETLPDGNPSISGTAITPAFNYTTQNATFVGLCDGDCTYFEMIITGNPVSGFGLSAWGEFTDVVAIRADIVEPVTAVGTLFPGNTTFSAYNDNNQLLRTETFSGSGEDFFIGFVSDEAIAYTIQTRGSDSECCEEYLIGPTFRVPNELPTWGQIKHMYR
jgi:hypothetical protein